MSDFPHLPSNEPNAEGTGRADPRPRADSERSAVQQRRLINALRNGIVFGVPCLAGSVLLLTGHSLIAVFPLLAMIILVVLEFRAADRRASMSLQATADEGEAQGAGFADADGARDAFAAPRLTWRGVVWPTLAFFAAIALLGGDRPFSALAVLLVGGLALVADILPRPIEDAAAPSRVLRRAQEVRAEWLSLCMGARVVLWMLFAIAFAIETVLA